MKKILMAAVILFLFAASISVVEISCKKADAQARPAAPASSTTILYSKPAIKTITGTDTTFAGANFFVCNIDGSNVRQIPIPLPADKILAGYSVAFSARLTPAGDSIIFQANIGSNYPSIYSCALDGTGLNLIASGGYTVLCDVK